VTVRRDIIASNDNRPFGNQIADIPVLNVRVLKIGNEFRFFKGLAHG